MTWAEVRARRLRRHHLLTRAKPADLVTVVRDICGVHAQLQPAAELALGMRVDGLRRADVRAELWERRRLVRLPSLRGTIHLLLAEDAPVWLAAGRAGADPFFAARRLKALGLEQAQMTSLVEAIADALDGRQLTLRELGSEVAARAGAWALEGDFAAFGGSWPHWRSALYNAAARGYVCFGRDRGREVTYVRPEQWLAAWPRPEPQSALDQALRWYLGAFGPAQPVDFERWLAIRPAGAREAFTRLRDELVEVDLEGEQRWDLAECAAEPAGDPSSVRLLPHFDQYLLGSHPRRLLFSVFLERRMPVAGGGNLPALLVDGEVAGIWRRSPRQRSAEVVVDAFRPLGRAQLRELGDEVARIQAFTGTETSLRLGPVEARYHA